jgi:hypothetical protein
LPRLPQSSLLITAQANLPGAAVAAVQESALRIEFQNQSRIVALPGESDATIRGYSDARLLVIDEAARVPDSLYTATRPMLAVSGGRLVCLSTPYGRRGWFFEEWTAGGDWQRTRIEARECPRISPGFLEAGISANSPTAKNTSANLWRRAARCSARMSFSGPSRPPSSRCGRVASGPDPAR